MKKKYKLKLVGWIPGQGCPELGYVIFTAKKKIEEIGEILKNYNENEKVWLELIKHHRVITEENKNG